MGVSLRVLRACFLSVTLPLLLLLLLVLLLLVVLVVVVVVVLDNQPISLTVPRKVHSLVAASKPRRSAVVSALYRQTARFSPPACN